MWGGVGGGGGGGGSTNPYHNSPFLFPSPFLFFCAGVQVNEIAHDYTVLTVGQCAGGESGNLEDGALVSFDEVQGTCCLSLDPTDRLVSNNPNVFFPPSSNFQV